MSKNESDSIVFHFCGNELRISRWLDIRIRIKRIFNITQELCCKIDNILLVPFVSSPPAPLIRSARRPLVWSFSIGEYGGPLYFGNIWYSAHQYTICRSLVHLYFVNVLWHLFHKFLWDGGLSYSCHPAQASSIIEYGKLKSNVTKTSRTSDRHTV